MNTKRNKTKTLLVVGLLLAVSGLTLGFAAFSNTLTIKSSATVTPDASTFSVQLSASETEILVGEENPISSKGSSSVGSGTAIIDAEKPTTISNISSLSYNANGTLQYIFYVHNTGEYDAYLNEIIFHNVEGTDSLIKCTAIETGDETRATDALVEAACSADDTFYLRVMLDLTAYSETTKVSGHKLEKGSVETVKLYVNNKSKLHPVDGPYTIDFGDIELVYSTADVNATPTE